MQVGVFVSRAELPIRVSDPAPNSICFYYPLATIPNLTLAVYSIRAQHGARTKPIAFDRQFLMKYPEVI